jgi:hypothetical protein
VKKLLLTTAFVMLALPWEPLQLLAAETFDWGKYCGDDCDRGDVGVGKWLEPPSQAELRACTKNGKLDYDCLRDSHWGKITDYKICFREEGGKLDSAGEPQCGEPPDIKPPPARVTVAPPYQGPPPIGWVYAPYTQCANPPQCSMGVVNVPADGLNVRTVPNGPAVMSLVNGVPLIPVSKEGDWILVAAGCDLTPTFAWSWTAGVPLNRCWVYF